MTITNPDVYGLSEDHLVHWRDWQLQKSIINDLEAMFHSAQQAGFELGIASAFRSFDRQLVIWNAKANGLRPTLDDWEQAINLQLLPPSERVEKILRWTALPGTSRHHWGTDFDVYDAGMVEATNYKLQLTRAETEPGGIFAQMYQWLDDYLLQDDCPFFRPYAEDRGGVAVEPWHLSHKVSAEDVAQRLSVNELQMLFEQAQIELLDPVLENLDAIVDRFVRVST